MNLATKDIRHNFGRFALTTLGIGMLLMIVMGMGGIYRGIVEDATILIDLIDADLWVVQRDTRGPFAEVSRVPANLMYRVAAVPGVKSAREFVYHTIQRETEGKPIRMAVLGLSWPTDKGEWVPLTEGRFLGQSHYEMIADESLGLGIGQPITLGKEIYTVVGKTRNMLSSSGDGIAFVTVADSLSVQFDTSGEAIRLERAARERRGRLFELGIQQPKILENAWKASNQLPAIPRPSISAVVLSVQPGVDTREVAETIAGWTDVSVFTRDGQRELLLKGSVEKTRRQIGLFRVLLTVIAAVIMTLILYTLTLDKIRSIALLKLIGAPNRVILGLVLQQALILGSFGFVIALALGSKIFPNFPRRVILTTADLIQLAIIVLIISVLSSLLGIWKALRVSPNEALA